MDTTIVAPQPEYVHHRSGRYRMTPGVAELYRSGTDWLIDIIAKLIDERPEIHDVWHVVWTLRVQDQLGVLTASDGDDNTLLVEPIGLTHARDNLVIWLMAGKLLLPSEY